MLNIQNIIDYKHFRKHKHNFNPIKMKIIKPSET